MKGKRTHRDAASQEAEPKSSLHEEAPDWHDPGDLPQPPVEGQPLQAIVQLLAGIVVGQDLSPRDTNQVIEGAARILDTEADSNAVVQRLANLSSEDPTSSRLSDLVSFLLSHPKLGDATHRAVATTSETPVASPRPDEAFPDGIGEMPSIRPMWTVQEAILHNEAWYRDEDDGFPRYRPRDRKGDVIVGYQPPGASITDLPDDFIHNLMNKVRKMDLDALDTLCITVNLLAKSDDFSANITPQAIARMRGVKYPNSHENFLRYRDALKHVTHLTMEATVPWLRQNGALISISGHLVLVDASVHQQSLGGGRKVLGWRVIAGSALKAILNHTRNLTEVFPQSLIELDTYHQEMGKRLGVYLTWIFRVRAHRGDYAQPFTPRSLIEAANIAVKATQHRQKQSQFRERFENSLDILQERCVIGGWHYLSSPDEVLLQNRGQLRRGWFNMWLDLPLRIDPPEQALIRYAPALKGAASYLKDREVQGDLPTSD